MEVIERKDSFPSNGLSHTDHDTLAAAQRRLEGEGGYRIDPKLFAENETLKLSSDGRTVLISQPSDDPSDPLNWSTSKKAVLLAVITAASFLPDYGSARAAVTLIPQAAYWKISVEQVSHSLAGNVLCSALVASSLWFCLPTSVASQSSSGSCGVPYFLASGAPQPRPTTPSKPAES